MNSPEGNAPTSRGRPDTEQGLQDTNERRGLHETSGGAPEQGPRPARLASRPSGSPCPRTSRPPPFLPFSPLRLGGRSGQGTIGRGIAFAHYPEERVSVLERALPLLLLKSRLFFANFKPQAPVARTLERECVHRGRPAPRTPPSEPSAVLPFTLCRLHLLLLHSPRLLLFPLLLERDLGERSPARSGPQHGRRIGQRRRHQ